MDFYPAFRGSKARPRKDRRAKIDCGCIQRINRFIKLKAEIVIGIKLSGLSDQNLGEVTVNTPIPFFVGIGKRAFGNFTLDPDVMKLVVHCP